MKTFKQIAEECASRAGQARRSFMKLFWIGIAGCVLYIILGSLFIIAKRLPTGIIFLAISGIFLYGALRCKKDAKRFFAEYMELRDECLDKSIKYQ